jgi:V/A-type H+-transporting ATPase subunit C
MMTLQDDITLSDFYRYPPVGEDDWDYMYASAKVRALEITMLSRGMLADMINAPDFAAATEFLSSTEYAIAPGSTDAQIERMLQERRTAARALFADLMQDNELVRSLQAREDFANMRLAIRRLVTDKPLGLDYSNEGGVPAEEFEDILRQENYERLPDYLQDAVEAAILGYYENKDIRRIDYGIDRVEYQWRIHQAEKLGNVFFVSYARILVDLYNIRTMLRLKAAEREEKEFFFDGGFVDMDKFVHGLTMPYESISAMFFATPYYELVEEGVRYLRSDQSFLRLEQQCEDYLMGFLKSTREIAAGPQPVIAYFLMKEAEIRTLRMILTGKKNSLSPRLILDRLGSWQG